MEIQILCIICLFVYTFRTTYSTLISAVLWAFQVILSFENHYNEAQNSHSGSLQFLKGIPNSGLFVCSFWRFEGAKKTQALFRIPSISLLIFQIIFKYWNKISMIYILRFIIIIWWRNKKLLTITTRSYLAIILVYCTYFGTIDQKRDFGDGDSFPIALKI